jgi:hypothetical protein
MINNTDLHGGNHTTHRGAIPVNDPGWRRSHTYADALFNVDA